MAPDAADFHITVEFGRGFDPDLQARILFWMEKMLREQGVPAEVYKATMPDDSKLRRLMTVEERKKL